MKLTSQAFKDQGIIPSKYTCEGMNINPPLEFSEVPIEAKSLVLIMDDPDVPSEVRPDRMYDHWVLFNIPPAIRNLEEGAKLPPGIQGKNTAGKSQYTGPCPPDREHRYFFKLYALDVELPLPMGSTKKEVERAMKKHILSECTLIGRYEKGKGY